MYALFLQGQKVDIDNHWVYISCVDFPDNYIPEKYRTYSIKTSGSSTLTGKDVADNINIFGWTKTNGDAEIDMELSMYGFFPGIMVTSSRKQEKKDKDGKVISTTIYYKASTTNKTQGEFVVYGPKNEYSKFIKPNKSDIKTQQKRKEETNSNPFLQGVNTDGMYSDDNYVGSNNVAYKYSLDREFYYNTSEYTNAADAHKEYNSNHYNIAKNHENTFRKDYPGWLQNFINDKYGYIPKKYNVRFKRLDSDNHPEFVMFDNATKALKLIFAKMRYNKPENEIARDLKPIIEYFESVTQKYASKDKNDKKLSGAALYNLARIYQYLDLHEKAIEIGNRIVRSDFDKDDGLDFIEESEEIMKKLKYHRMKSRHIVPKNAWQQEDYEGEIQASNK